jgi:hypothetical protein
MYIATTASAIRLKRTIDLLDWRACCATGVANLQLEGREGNHPMNKGHPASSALLLLFLVSCASAKPRNASESDGRVAVRFVDDEAVAALEILEKEFARHPVAESEWQRLFSSEGYIRLKARETYMNRAFTDADFRAFIESDSLVRRTPSLRATLTGMRKVDFPDAGSRALRYLPANARIVARVYPEIKPRTNSFVFSADSVPGIFLYVDPSQSPAVFQNTLTHELHHIGLNNACRSQSDSTLKEPIRTLVRRMGGFGEGLAMLAAAGSPDTHAHSKSDVATRERWDRDVANHQENLRLLEKFFLDVAELRVTSPDSVNTLANQFYGEQGPWYTVGWKMAVVIEKRFGRARLVSVMCNPPALLRTYNEAAAIQNRSGIERLPSWSDKLLELLPR